MEKMKQASKQNYIKTRQKCVTNYSEIKIYILTFVLLIIVCSFVLNILYLPQAPIAYVSGDGSGDYNCDGKDDHVQINQALEFVAQNSEYTTVHLKGPFTYIIDDTLLISSNTILQGDSNAVIKLTDNAGWPQYKGIIEPKGETAQNITIQGFEIDGNSQSQSVSKGASYYTLLLLDDCTNITVRNMYFHDSCNDGVRVLNAAYNEGKGNINVYNNVFYRCCHNAIYLMKVSDSNIYNNTITPRTNDGITITDSNHISIHDNVIDPEIPTGGCGIDIQKTLSVPAMDDIEIYRNKISNTNLVGILVHGYNSYPVPSGAKDVYIHDNKISGCGQNKKMSLYWGGGINVQGFNNTVIENNVINGCYHDGISFKNVWSKPPTFVYNTIIRNNVITNTLPGRFASDSGYGIDNYDASMYTAVLEYNNVWNNTAGNYRGIKEGKTD